MWFPVIRLQMKSVVSADFTIIPRWMTLTLGEVPLKP